MTNSAVLSPKYFNVNFLYIRSCYEFCRTMVIQITGSRIYRTLLCLSFALTLFVFIEYKKPFVYRNSLNGDDVISRLSDLEERIERMYSKISGSPITLPRRRQENVLIDSGNIYRANTNHTTTLTTQTRCRYKYKLLIMVTSHLTHSSERNRIRDTWGVDRYAANSDPLWRTVFLVGRSYNKKFSKKVKKESEKYGDIIFGEIYEDFFHLTFKVQMGFEWAVRYCNFDFLLKADDDIFVNIPQLLIYVDEPETPRTELYAGNVYFDAKVARGGRYGVAYDEYSKVVYPRYCSGGGFILSRDVIELMLPQFNLVNPLKIDDVYVGLLALKVGVDATYLDNFNMFESGSKCKYQDKLLVHHPVKTDGCMEKLYKLSMSNRNITYAKHDTTNATQYNATKI